MFKNTLTGEHPCIMLKPLHGEETEENWLTELWRGVSYIYLTIYLFLLSQEINFTNSFKSHEGRQCSKATSTKTFIFTLQTYL